MIIKKGSFLTAKGIAKNVWIVSSVTKLYTSFKRVKDGVEHKIPNDELKKFFVDDIEFPIKTKRTKKKVVKKKVSKKIVEKKIVIKKATKKKSKAKPAIKVIKKVVKNGKKEK